MTGIKAVFFDLDDTLFDCTGLLVKNARKRAARALVASGVNLSERELLKRIERIYKEFGPRVNVFQELLRELKINNPKLVEVALRAYNSDRVENIKPFKAVPQMLQKLRKDHKLVLITSGIRARQERKLRLLKLKGFFDLVLFHDVEMDSSKQEFFVEALQRLSLKPHEILVVGDRIHSEIKIGNELGMTTVRVLKGRFKELKPSSDLEEADFVVKGVSELLPVLRGVDSSIGSKNSRLKIVVIGGGTGLPVMLKGLKRFTSNLTAIVTVTDSGRSSGKLRKGLGILPPGDIRNCLVALSDSEELLLDLFNYRFSSECELNGHSFGNLFIAALTKVKGNFLEAIKETSRVLKIKGKVLPSTLANVQVFAELADGSLREGDVAIYEKNKPRIRRVFIKPAGAKPLDEALREIAGADLIVLGPGSLFTSIIPNLLIKGISRAVAGSSAKRVFVCNVMLQPGQTDGFTALEHVREIEKYLGRNVLDFVLLNKTSPSKRLRQKYEETGAALVKDDISALPEFKNRVVGADLIEGTSGKRVLWEKQDLLRHDSGKIAKTLVGLLNN